MADVMQGIAEDVRFNHGAASLLASRCRAAANAIDNQAPGRAAWVRHGLEDFQGYYSQLFAQNGQVQASDASLLAARLREVASGAEQLSREARSEQQRRQTAREWKQRQDDRNWLEQGRDLIFGGEDPPVGPPAQPITLTYAQASTTPRQPLEGQSGSGTSSARPANLRSFATNSAGAYEGLAPHPGLLRDAYSSFTSGCGWGSLSADGVWAGFDAYLTANGNDVIWANTVAAAFEAAGSDDVVTASNAAITQTLAAAGVHAERQDLQIDPPQAYGAPPTTGYANDPVNTATGNFLEPESPGNARLGIDGSGNVAVQGDNVLFLNFGDRPRADAFLEQRLAQGFDGTEIKAFDVPDSYADSIRNRAAPEAQARGNPVFQVDTTRTDSSFGLRSSEFPGLVDAAIPGSGRVVAP